MTRPVDSVTAGAAAAAALPPQAGMGEPPVEAGDHPPTLGEFLAVCEGRQVQIAPGVLDRMARSEQVLADALHAGVTVYGVTTAYGADSARRIDPADRPAFQLATLRSHACGTGTPLSWQHARGVWFAKYTSLATGLTGASPTLAVALAGLLNEGFAPLVPSSGSLGASGDLIPSAHAALPLAGEGEVLARDRTVVSATTALEAAGLTPAALGPRDGLSLVNGTAVTASLSTHAVAAAERLVRVAEALAAAALEAAGGHEAAFSESVTEARPHPGAVAAATAVRGWLTGTDPADLGRTGIHDPYAWRCLPQVHGAAREAAEWAARACLTELASCTDNPIISAEDQILSGGNFHAAPLGIPMDGLRLGIGEVAALSRQRIAHLAALLAGQDGPEPSAGGGLIMILTTATAALLAIGSAGPATGRWLPVDDFEDHVSNATTAAQLTLTAVDHAWTVLAAEAIAIAVCARQAACPQRSAAGRWLAGVLASAGGADLPIRLDTPLAGLLERARRALAHTPCETPAGGASPERAIERC